MASPRVLVIGVDSAGPEVVAHLVGEGRMPVLGALLASAATYTVHAPPGVYTAGIWPSIYTGRSPGGHGRYNDHQLVPGTYRYQYFHPGAIAGTPFWDVLGEAGYRVAVVDVPHTTPTPGFNGAHVSGWGGCSADQELTGWPPDLAGDIVSKFGPHPVGWDCGGPGDGPDEWAALRDNLVQAVRTRTDMASTMAGSEAWDLMLYVFSEAHCAGHNCWHLHDPCHPRHSAAIAKQVGSDPVAAVYEEIDRGIGRLLEEAGAGSLCAVLLSHGMGPNYTGNHLLDTILLRLEQGHGGGGTTPGPGLKATVWRSLPPPLKKVVKSGYRAFAPAHDRPLDHREWAARESFAVRNNTGGAIRVNLRGREPRGRVSPNELDDYCKTLAAQLEELVDAGSGRPVVERVVRTSELLGGEVVDLLPDLVVEWDASQPIRSVSSPGTGTITGENPDHRSGDHRPRGLLAITGPGVVAGAQPEALASTEVAATIAALMGAALPGFPSGPDPRAAHPAH